MILYDGLLVGCQGDFVTSFHNEIIKNQDSNKFQALRQFLELDIHLPTAKYLHFASA
jgi:hypothetical protein